MLNTTIYTLNINFVRSPKPLIYQRCIPGRLVGSASDTRGEHIQRWCQPERRNRKRYDSLRMSTFSRIGSARSLTYIPVQLINSEGLPRDYLGHQIAHGDKSIELAIFLKPEGAEYDGES